MFQVTGPITEDELLRDACFTDVQWRALMAWAATQDEVVYAALNRAKEFACVPV